MSDRVGQRQRHRRTARAGGDHGVTQAEPHPLVDQRRAERGLHVLRRGVMIATIRAYHRHVRPH